MKSRILICLTLVSCMLFLSRCKDDNVAPAIVIESVTPIEGHYGDEVTISGQHFDSNSSNFQISFNGKPATIISATNTEVKVTVPTDATSGKILLTSNGRSGESTHDFVVLIPPVITSFSPEAGGIGYNVTLTGSNFATLVDQNVVTVNGVPASVMSASSTQLVITIPQGATTGKIAVTVKGKSFISQHDFIIIPTNEWQEVADFTGPARYYGVSFSIGTKGYIATGRKFGGSKLKDLWEYDPSTNTWIQRADFPGTAREGCIAFTIGSKAYVGTGFTGQKQKDFWEYDPQLNTWVAKDNFGGGDRVNAFAFVIGNKAYVGGGIQGDNHETKHDFWEFDPTRPAGQQWIQKNNIGPQHEPELQGALPAAAFAINGKGFVAFPLSNGQKPDFWVYDPANDSWQKKDKSPFDVLASSLTTTFTIGPYAYVLASSNLWKYDPTAHTWTQRMSYPESYVRYPLGFAIGSNAYAGIGLNVTGSVALFDFHKYYPD